MGERQWQDNALTVLMTSGFISIPGVLLKKYKQLGLQDTEMMLLLQLLQFQQEGVVLPTFQELAERMTTPEEEITSMLRHLVRLGLLDLVEQDGGALYNEAYDLRPLYQKLSDALQPKRDSVLSSMEMLEKKEQNVFALFEQEFGRPLSPLEYEKIVRWLDEDRYREELIREALQEAVLAAKFNFKYIDRILYEWQKNNIRTMQELNVYREQFRNRMPSSRGRTGSANQQGQNQAAKRKMGGDNVKSAQGMESKYDDFYKMYGDRD